MADETPEWTPPQHDAATGVAMHGDYPLNTRLRAEALSDAGQHDDPDGLVSPELIRDAGARLQAERAEAEAATPSMAWSRDRLAKEAARLKREVPEDATKAVLLDAINAAPAAETEA
jgi:hypothetical protein